MTLDEYKRKRGAVEPVGGELERGSITVRIHLGHKTDVIVKELRGLVKDLRQLKGQDKRPAHRPRKLSDADLDNARRKVDLLHRKFKLVWAPKEDRGRRIGLKIGAALWRRDAFDLAGLALEGNATPKQAALRVVAHTHGVSPITLQRNLPKPTRTRR